MAAMDFATAKPLPPWLAPESDSLFNTRQAGQRPPLPPSFTLTLTLTFTHTLTLTLTHTLNRTWPSLSPSSLHSSPPNSHCFCAAGGLCSLHAQQRAARG